MMKTDDFQVMMDKSLLLKLELFDGTSQIVQITEEQAAHLGINIAENGPGFVIPVTNEVQSSQQIVGAVQDNSVPADGCTNENEAIANYMYKIIKPEDLDLRPITSTHAPRGRPRKRPNEETTQEQSKTAKEPQIVIKQVRTRSGRITKPPRYIGQDFRIINTSEDVKHDTELKTIEYDTLKTSETYPLEPHLHLEQHSRKRNIPSHYRCPTCKKAYLGKMKMLNHFNKYPDHGPVPNFCKTEHNSTWNFLILTSQKFKEGSKGVKFCQELMVLLENARTLAKFLFKPVKDGENGYFIDEYLANVFGIVSGDYILNENELHKDASLHAFLEKKCKEKKGSDGGASNTIKSEGSNVVMANHSKNELKSNNDKPCTSEMYNCDKEVHKDVSSVTVDDINKRMPINDVIVESARNEDGGTNFSSHPISTENMDTSDASQNENNCHQIFLQKNSQLSTDSVNARNKKHFSMDSSNGENDCRQTYLKENGNSLNTPEKKHFLLDGHNAIGFANLNNLESVLDSAERLNNDSINYHHALNVNMKFDNACVSLRGAESSKESEYKRDVATSNDDKCSSGYDINKHIAMGNDLLAQVDDLILQNVGARVNQNRSPSRCISQKKCNNYGSNKHSLDNELLSHVDELMLENVSNNAEEHKQTSVMSTQVEIPKKHQSDVKKNSDYDIDKHMRMHSELLSHVEDLILENIDTGQVSNILETSSNSDDIMNVDQFVNERFKKLTEPDIELQNTSLNLDLPPLDMFNFHTS